MAIIEFPVVTDFGSDHDIGVRLNVNAKSRLVHVFVNRKNATEGVILIPLKPCSEFEAIVHGIEKVLIDARGVFVEQGEQVKVDTRTGEYVSRVKS